MAKRSWTPDRGFVSGKVVRPASVSTSLSLELCAPPATLGSSVAAAALQQLLVVEKSLQGDYFKCNEEVKTFLKDIIIAVKKLGEMRKRTIELLEIESMELSRLYFLLETVPSTINKELEECIGDARKLNISEINQMQTEIEKKDYEEEFLKKQISELKELNEALGVKQAQLAKRHKKYVLALNQTLEEKAAASICINDTYTRINFERKEIEAQNQSLKDTTELIDKHKEKHLEKKEFLSNQVGTGKKLRDFLHSDPELPIPTFKHRSQTSLNDAMLDGKEEKEMKEFKQFCETRRKEAYTKKKELTRLQNKIIKMKQTVTSSTVLLSDHGAEMLRLQESLSTWQEKVEDLKRVCMNLEEKLQFFMIHKDRLDAASAGSRDEYLVKIRQVAEKLCKIQAENKDLKERLHILNKQYKSTLKEEENVYLQREKALDENQKLMTFINQKESFLAQRKMDIRSMEDGFETLKDLCQATKETYRKQIKVMIDNLEREIQRSVVARWKIACSKKRHARWLLNIKVAMKKIVSEIELSEERRVELLEETKERELEISEFVDEIKKITKDLEKEERDFVRREKKLIKEVNKFEDLIMKETQINKEKEEELSDSLPQLHLAEEEYLEKSRSLKSIHSEVSVKKQEQNLLGTYIFRFRKDIIRYTENTESLKNELKRLRDWESEKNKRHFEALKELENEVYANDYMTTFLILENKRLKEFLDYLKKQIQMYREKQEITVNTSGDLSWQLIAQHKHYGDLLAQFQVTIKELVEKGEETVQKIKTLMEKLKYRDQKIEVISAWLKEGIQRLRRLMEEYSRTLLFHKHLIGKRVKKQKKNKEIECPQLNTRKNAPTGAANSSRKQPLRTPENSRKCECT